MFSKRLARRIEARGQVPEWSRGMFAVAVEHKEKTLEGSAWSPPWPLSSRGCLVRNAHYDLRCVAVSFSLWISSEQTEQTLTRTMK